MINALVKGYFKVPIICQKEIRNEKQIKRKITLLSLYIYFFNHAELKEQKIQKESLQFFFFF